MDGRDGELLYPHSPHRWHSDHRRADSSHVGAGEQQPPRRFLWRLTHHRIAIGHYVCKRLGFTPPIRPLDHRTTERIAPASASAPATSPAHVRPAFAWLQKSAPSPRLMQKDLFTIFYTLLVDVCIFCLCYLLWILVSEGQPLATNILLPHTWQYKVIGRTVYARLCCGFQCQAQWVTYLCCWRHKLTQEQREEQRKRREEKAMQAQAVGAVVLEQQPCECETDAQAVTTAPLLPPQSSSDDTPPPLPGIAANEEAKSLDTSADQDGTGGLATTTAPLRFPHARYPSGLGSGPRPQEMELASMPAAPVATAATTSTATSPVSISAKDSMPPSPPMRPAATHVRHHTYSSHHGDTLSPDDAGDGSTYRTLSIQQALGTDGCEVQTIRRRANSSRRGSVQATQAAQAALLVEGSAQRRSVSFAPGTKGAVEVTSRALGTNLDSPPGVSPTGATADADGANAKQTEDEVRLEIVRALSAAPLGSSDVTQPASESSPPPGRRSLSVKGGGGGRTSQSKGSRRHSHSQSAAGAVPSATGSTDEEVVESPAFHESAEAPIDGHTLPVLVVPVQEGVAASAQVLVTPPRHKLRFQLVEPLLERLFPRIRILGANAVDGYIYLKYLQLTILMVAIMTIIALPLLLSVHVTRSPDGVSSYFTMASIASVPYGSPWFIAHFVVAMLFLVLLHMYVRLLALHGVKSTRLSTVLTDDKETIAARRTVHIRNMDLDFLSEAELKREILALLPPGTSEAQILSISLFTPAEGVRRAMGKKARVLDQIERLEILAAQEQEAAKDNDPRKQIKKIWLKVLHAPGTLSVHERLKALQAKKDKYTKLVAMEVWRYYEQASAAAAAMEEGHEPAEAAPAASPAAAPAPSSSPMGSPLLAADGAGSSPAPVPTATATAADDAAPARPYLGTGQAFVSFRASALAGQVVKTHRETRSMLRVRLNNLGLHRVGQKKKNRERKTRGPGPSPSPTVLGNANANDQPGADDPTSSPFAAVLSPLTRLGSDGNGNAARRSPPIDPRSSLQSREWAISFAPKPSDILWDNLGPAQENLFFDYTRWILANAGWLVIMLFVGLPALFLNQVKPVLLKEISHMDPESVDARVISFCINYFTTLLMSVINSHYSPFIMTKALEFEKHPTRSSYLASMFFKQSVFLLCNLILLPIFAMSTVADLIDRVQTSGPDETWYTFLSSAFFVSSGIYYIQYFIHSIFINSGMQLLDLPGYLKRVWNLRTALTKKDFEAAKIVTTAPTNYQTMMTVFALLLLLSVSVPLLLPFGLVFLIAQYCIDIYMMRKFKVASRYNKGTVPTMVARYTLLYLSGWEFVMAALFFTQNLSSYYVLGILFLVFAIGTLVLYAVKEFSTKVPIDLHISALEHLDEKITIFKELMPDLRTDSVSAEHVLLESRTNLGYGDKDEPSQTGSKRRSKSSSSASSGSSSSSSSDSDEEREPLSPRHQPRSNRQKRLLFGMDKEAVHSAAPRSPSDDAALDSSRPPPSGARRHPPLLKQRRLAALPVITDDDMVVACRVGSDAPCPTFPPSKLQREACQKEMTAHHGKPDPCSSIVGVTSPSCNHESALGASPSLAAPSASPPAVLATPSAGALSDLLGPQLLYPAGMPGPGVAFAGVTSTGSAFHAVGAAGTVTVGNVQLHSPPSLLRASSLPLPDIHPHTSTPIASALPVANAADAAATDATVAAAPMFEFAPTVSSAFLPPRLTRSQSLRGLKHSAPSKAPYTVAESRRTRRQKSTDLFRPLPLAGVAGDIPGSDAGATTSTDPAASAAPPPTFTHAHAHRPPMSHTASHSQSVHASLRHLSCVDSSLCPDCLYRHPIWKSVEADAEVMDQLRKMEEDFNDQVERAAAGEMIGPAAAAASAAAAGEGGLGAASGADPSVWLHRELNDDEEDASDSSDDEREDVAALRQQFLIARQRSIMRAASQRKLSLGIVDEERSRSSRSSHSAMLTVRVTAPEPRRAPSSAARASSNASSLRESSGNLSPELATTTLASRMRAAGAIAQAPGSPSSADSIPAAADEDVIIRFHQLDDDEAEEEKEEGGCEDEHR